MRVAIYARRSVGQNVSEESKSVTRQRENARDYALKQGWTVVAEFEDDAISGAEFEKRPGDPNIRELEPDPRMAQARRCAQTRGMTVHHFVRAA